MSHTLTFNALAKVCSKRFFLESHTLDHLVSKKQRQKLGEMFQALALPNFTRSHG